VVVPPWEVERLGKEEQHIEECPGIRIIIDPGMAFGTGTHETTAMCLAKLKALIKNGDTVLDVGAGSGILSIAAALLGAGEIYAVEIDEDAAASACGNITLNGAGEMIHLVAGDIREPGLLPESMRFDLIMANLSCSLIEMILPDLGGLLAQGGKMIISGLIDTQEERAIDAVRKAGLETIEICRSGEWIALVARKNGDRSVPEAAK
jgi:ribosomal protein L11 methyltransferase